MTPLIDDADGNEFFAGFGKGKLDPACHIAETKGTFPVLSPDQEARRVQGMKNAWKCPELRARQSASTKACSVQHLPEVRARKSAVMKEVCNRPEERLARSERAKAMWARRKGTAK